MSSGCVLVTFYSDPAEAFLTSVFRVLEVFGCYNVVVLSSKDRFNEVEKVVECVKGCFPSRVEFYVYPDFPPSYDLEGFNGLVEKVYRRLKDVLSRGIVIVATYAGSRVEVSTTVLASSRVREGSVLVYTPFFWGPWSGLFYPFTPRPLEPLVVMHPDAESVKELAGCCEGFNRMQGYLGGLGNRVLDLFSCIGGDVSELRRRVSYEQFKMNLGYARSPMLYPVNQRCTGVEVSIAIGGIGRRITVAIGDYCNAKDVVEAVHTLGEDLLKLRDEVQPQIEGVRALDLLFRFSSVLIPVLEECNHYSRSCSESRDLVLVDALNSISRGRSVLVDTNILYSSLHVQLYDQSVRGLRIPLCTYVELLKHVVHYRDSYERLRSEVAAIALDEVKTLGIPLESSVSQQPCEVGMALARDSLSVTMDRHAYMHLFKHLNVEAVLVAPKPIKSIGFLRRENVRRTSYAYYALAQLKALKAYPRIDEALREAKVVIEFRQR